MGIDLLQGDTTLQEALVDVDDGTLDGSARLDHDDWNSNGQTSSELVTGSVITDRHGLRGDGLVDMKDFREYRDALLQVLTDNHIVLQSEVSLDGDANHLKKDLNQDGRISSDPSTSYPYAFEGIYSRFDFNGNGTLEPEGRFTRFRRLGPVQDRSGRSGQSA